MQTKTMAAAALMTAMLAGAAPAQLDLVWSDEFDGPTLDLSKWEPMIGNGCSYGVCDWGNNEWQYYTDRPENIAFSGGVMSIIARNEFFGGKQYTSARLRTLNKGDFLYGRIEARLQLPDAGGVWPAFWMLPTGSPYGGWAASGEIDIMESINTPSQVHGTLHYGNDWPNNVSTGGSTTMGGTDFGAGFHVYAIEWEADVIRWYIDDVLFSTKTSAQWFSNAPAASGNPRAPFDTPFHILLNVAVGGNWPGNPTPGDYPVQMNVDYVRVYSFSQAPFTGDDQPHPVPGLIETEDFDKGLAGEAYFDADGTNNGGQYRTTGVDIEVCDEGGFNIGWVEENEWLEYTIDVAETGTYRIDTRVASQTTGGTYRFEIDGSPVSGDIYAAPTGGWQNWATSPAEVDLTAGQHVLRWANRSSVGAGYNLNHFDFVLLGDDPCVADIDGNGSLNVDDVDAFVAAFIGGDLSVDLDGNGSLNVDDVDAFVSAFIAGCP
ncbi:MAG: hypothetical protein DHS20C14_04750 [Phycisphaeraceae bacterium]|nr:MAG: hypothetical protein DHS20C14_04750 [Phycisphaeraceae bacterium]